MIDNIVSSDPDIIAVSYYNNGAYTSGALYWDANSRNLKIVDSNGTSQSVPQGSASITVGSKLQEMVAWFERKRAEEQQVAELCKNYPNLAEAKREFDVLYNIIKEQK
jgi:hypothetical protein